MLASWKESYGQPRQHTKNQRHYFANNVQIVKGMVFPVVTYGCESWTIKKSECSGELGGEGGGRGDQGGEYM